MNPTKFVVAKHRGMVMPLFWKQLIKKRFMKIHTESNHFHADEKLIEFIERKLSKLDNYFDKIIEVRVNLKLENSGKVRDKVVEVRISVPGDVLVAKETEKTFESAIDKLTNVLKRQVIKYKERLRGAG